MTQLFFYQNTDLGNQRVRLGSIASISQSAERGVVATSTIELDDPLGVLDLPPFFGFQWYEDSAAQPLIYTGYGSNRNRNRVPEQGLIVEKEGRLSLQLEDLNAQLTFRVVNHNTAGYKRPAEDDYHRIDWLLGGLLSTTEDNGLIDRNPLTNVQMSPVDYTGQTPDQVLQDCSDLSGKNYFLYPDPTTGNRSLAYFKSDDASFYPSGLFISNDPNDIGNADTYTPVGIPALSTDPSQTYNGGMMDYSGGTIYLQHGTNLPLIRDVIIPSANTSSKSHATALVQKYLEAASFERETVTCTIQVPAANINDLAQGMLVNATFINFSGWEAGLDVRVLSRSISTEMSQDFYNVELVIGHPKLVSFATGQVPDNTKVWPSQQPPFVPTPGETPVFIQGAQTPDGTSTEDATLSSSPTEGNTLIGIALMLQPGGAVGNVEFGWPAGWNEILVTAPGILTAYWASMAYHVIGAGESSTVAVTSVIDHSSDPGGFILIEEWQGLGDAPTVIASDAGAASAAHLGSTSIPNLIVATPPALLVGGVVFRPNYTTSVSAPWTQHTSYDTTGGSRQRLSMVTSVPTTPGTYTGTMTSAGGTDADPWWIMAFALAGPAGTTPSIGQLVAPESATADGSRVIYQTNYPYVPGSLVVKVNGIILANVDETDPATGIFTLPAPPAAGAVITWTYNVADPAPTGANNPPPPSSGGSVPPDPGTMPGGDGIQRQPLAPFVPAETPNGVITVFTIPPYVAGTTLVTINGLYQRLTTDYTESSPGTGAITFTSAPWTGADIVIYAMPYHAAPNPTTGRSVTWGPPVTTATFVIPGSIDPTGATDVAAAINAWVESVPDGSILDFDGGTFKLTQGIQLSNRHNLVLWGNGATLNVDSGASGGSQLTSPIVVGHKFGGSWSLGSTDIAIHDFTLVGNNPTPGTFVPGSEAQANLELTGCTRLEVYDIDGSNAYGDFAFFEDITNGWLHDCTSTGPGRDGVSVISGNGIIVESCSLDDVGQNVFDIEPNNSSQACINITLRNCTATVWDNAFLGIEGSHTGAPIHGVIVSGNVISTDSLLSIVDNGNTSRMTDISIINNTSSGGSVAGPVITVKYTDNVTVTGNVQTHSGSLTSFTSCTNVVT